MMGQRVVVVGICLGLLLGLVAVLGLTVAGTQAQEPATGGTILEENEATSLVSDRIPVQGRLTDAAGHPLDGIFTIQFSLYSDPAGGSAICSNTKSVSVDNGLFSSSIAGSCNYTYLDGRQLYLGIKVEDDPEMRPLQGIYPVPYAFAFRPAAIISSTTGSAILHVENWAEDGRGLRAYAMATSGENYGIVGASRSKDGYAGYFYNNGGGTGLYSSSQSSGSVTVPGPGVLGKSDTGVGVRGESNAASTSSWGVFAENTGAGGALYAESDAAATSSHRFPTLYLTQKKSTGDLIVGANSGGGFDRVFRVDGNGRGYFNGGFQAFGADYAEQMPVAGEEASYEPGDVLAISASADGTVERSSEPYATAVIGVYSTQPALLGGAPDDDEPLAGIPVAILGIVPCKVSAENGPIGRGDLLVTSSTPGHAMRAGDTPPPGTVLGKALQPLDSGTGTIQVLVTLH